MNSENKIHPGSGCAVNSNLPFCDMNQSLLADEMSGKVIENNHLLEEALGSQENFTEKRIPALQEGGRESEMSPV